MWGGGGGIHACPVMLISISTLKKKKKKMHQSVLLSLFNWGHSRILDHVAQMGNLRRAHSVRSIKVVIMYLLLEIWNEMKSPLKLKIISAR